MPRRLIIGVLIVLILGIVGGTVVLIVQRLRGEPETDTATTGTTPGALQPADIGNQNITNPTGDDDGDGLSNADEALWNTSRTNADTDGDGFRDGEEVAGNHNPTVAGPNDLLPAGFKPGRDLQPLDAAPVQVDQYFADNLDLSGGNKNLTTEYKSQVAAKDQTPTSMSTYVQRQPIITKLPAPRASAIKIAAESNATATESYLIGVGSLSALTNKDGLTVALEELYKNNDPAAIRGLATQVRSYQDTILEQQVPPAAVPLQKLLLGYTELLAATFNQIALWPEDPLKSMVGLRQLETIDRQYYPLILQELNRLSL